MNYETKSQTELVGIIESLQRDIDLLKKDLSAAAKSGPEDLIEKNRSLAAEIEALKKRESTLLFEEQLFNTLMEHIPDSIYFKNAQSHFIRVNKAWANRRWLSSPEEVQNKTDFDFFPKDLAQSFYDDEQEIIRSGKPLVAKMEKIQLPGMEPRWISITKIPIIDKKTKTIIGTCGISHDVSRTTKMEEELQSERDMLHLLLDNSPDAIYFKDKDSRFIRISKAQGAKFGLGFPQEAIGKTDFEFFPIEHAQEAFDDEQNIIKSGKPIVGKIECETAPGEPEHWVFTTKMPIYDKNSAVVGTFGISRDITEVKMFEKALHKAKAELEARVEQRTVDLQKANKNLEARIEQLDFLTSVSYDMAQCINIEDLAPVILRSFAARFSEAIASLCVHTPKGFSCLGATGILNCDVGKAASEKALTVFHHSPLQRPFIVDNWPSDDYVSQFSWPHIAGFPFYLAIPLLADNQLIAIVQVFISDAGRLIYKEEEKVVATLAIQSAVSLSNALHYRELGEKARLQGELDAARSIQQRLTPSQKPSIPRVNLKGVYYPAFEVGGDYLDYFKTEDGNWVIVIADVCGKGIPAALLMTILRSAFRVEARNETSSKRLLCSVNDSMRVNLDDRSFVTAICLIINGDGTSMSYARAGHPKLIRVSAQTDLVETIESGGIALGFISEMGAFAGFVEEITIPLNTGDRYLIYTDGLTEAVNNEKEAFGTKRLLDLLSNDIGNTPEAMLDGIMRDVKAFTKGAPYHDDLTIIALEVSGEGRG
jgi:PAS domain S-box-containing protein